MANPSSRQGLIDYCLRQLGHPVLEINIDDDQLEDRIDEAFQFYRDFHYDATEKVYKSVLIDASLVQITGVNAASFSNGEKITGSASGATAFVNSNVSANRFKVYDVKGTFSAGETITGGTSGASATLSSITLGNYDNKYISLDDSFFGVERILQLSNKTSGMGMFDVRYQLLLNNIQSLTNTDIIYYSQLKTHLNLINDLMTGQKPVRFNRHMNRLFIDMDWRYDVKVGDYIIVEGWQFLDPDTYTDVYNDGFLKRYATALIKRQWGTNLKKFEGVQLPGGVTLNGQKIYDEAVEEIANLKDEGKNTYQLPIDFFTG
jgi:hypothetical protein